VREARKRRETPRHSLRSCLRACNTLGVVRPRPIQDDRHSLPAKRPSRPTARGRLAANDVVIIDCPPNLGCIPFNALDLSDAYLIPNVSDHLSTYGIPQIVARVHRLSERIGRTVALLGIVITKFQANSSVHNAVRARFEKLSGPPVFEDVIRQSNQIAAAAEFVKEQRTLRQNHGSEHAAALINLTKEFLNRERSFDGSL